jgi:4-amino-4-deoxy-L-arabinose transferase-like glycosyltransferase
VVTAIILPDQSATLPDAVAHRDAGTSLWATGQLGTPFHMPLYPALVGVLGPGWRQLAIDISLSTATIWLLYELTKLVFDQRTGLIAAGIAALYPHFIFFSVAGLTETLFMALLVAAYVAWYRGLNVLAAVFAVLAILTRPILDVLAPILVLYFSLAIHKQPIAAAARNLVIYAGIYYGLMAPWWLHNYQAYGTFVRLNLGGGLALLSGNNPGNQTGGIDINLGAASARFQSITDPVERDRAMQQAAIEYIKSDPQRFMAQAVLKLARFRRPWPHTESYRSQIYVLAALFSFVPVTLLAAASLVLCSRVQLVHAVPLLLFIAYLTAAHTVFPGSIRYRLPLEPFLVVLAAAAAAEFLRRLQMRYANTAAVSVGSLPVGSIEREK